jgi:hypothetical protein
MPPPLFYYLFTHVSLPLRVGGLELVVLYHVAQLATALYLFFTHDLIQ